MGAEGTSKDVVDRMTAELQKAFASKEVKDASTALGAEPSTLVVGQTFGDFVNDETKRWGKVVNAAAREARLTAPAQVHHHQEPRTCLPS